MKAREGAVENENIAKLLTRVGTVGVLISIFWWFIFYSRVISQTGGNAGDFGRVLECLIYSSTQCIVIKGIASIVGYWPYEPFFLWLSAGAAAVGAMMQSTSSQSQSPGHGDAYAQSRATVATAPRVRADTSSYGTSLQSDRWLVSGVLPDGQIIKFEISGDAPCKIVGRDPKQADVVITDNSISRPHARFDLKNGSLWISDLDSTNGTKVGGRDVRSKPMQLQMSDKIQLGLITLTVSSA